MGAFGATIPVTGLNNGFLGQISRTGERVVASRPVLGTTTNPISFGQGVVIVPTNGGGDTYQSIADFITGGGVFTDALFAGVAIREVKTNLAYVALETIPANLIGSYAQNEMAEALERGSVNVACTNGTPISQGPVFIRTAANTGIPGTSIGDFEATPDGTIAGVAAGGNTGNGTIGTLSLGNTAKPGVYVAKFTTATAYTVTDPTGAVVGTGVTGTAFTGLNGVTPIEFTITAGGTAFVAGDSFNITTTLKTVMLNHVVFRTGVIDANNVVEITLKERAAA
jgi:hypothetical protein